MHERVSIAEGTLSIDSGEQGTILRASLPLRNRDRPAATAVASTSQQAAS